MSAEANASAVQSPWQLPIDPRRYDRRTRLTTGERQALVDVVARMRPELRLSARWPAETGVALQRLIQPLDDVFLVTAKGDAAQVRYEERTATRQTILAEVHRRQVTFWGWGEDEWIDTLQRAEAEAQLHIVGVAYLLVGRRTLSSAFVTFRRPFAMKLFGRQAVQESISRLGDEVVAMGFGETARGRCGLGLSELMLRAGSPRLEDMTGDLLAAAYSDPRVGSLRPPLRVIGLALVRLGVLARSPLGRKPFREGRPQGAKEEAPAEWVAWAHRWAETSPLARKTREQTYYQLVKTGRWLAARHPEVVSPAAWTRQLAAEWVATVDRMLVGEWSHAPSTVRYAARLGLPISPRTKMQHIAALRTFIRDCQEWEWIPRRFDTQRAMPTPAHVMAAIGPDPRVIADEIWAKLLWAGLNLNSADLPVHHAGLPYYPTEMMKAMAVVWLFAGLRVDEIARLRAGCIRWQANTGGGDPAPATASDGPFCLLDVPVHKTGRPFTKPVDRLVGEAIEEWEKVRPTQPLFADDKTGESVHLLFAYRGQGMFRGFINRSLIPLLCRKANVPTADARGTITSHRARSTIATQLFSARDPMTLLELQAWLGHRTPQATQHYTKITPTRLARAYADAGYFERNVRMVDILVDQEAIRSGAAAKGQPWRYYDLGHGFCTYDFFDQCPHRMACAKCGFYRPKEATVSQLPEATANLLRLKQEIPLSDDERAAVDDGVAALERLKRHLLDTPTPGGPTPRQLGQVPSLHLIPVCTPEASSAVRAGEPGYRRGLYSGPGPPGWSSR